MNFVIKFLLLFPLIITSDDITYKRPGTGISPLFWDDVLGTKVIKNIKEDQLLSWLDLEIK